MRRLRCEDLADGAEPGVEQVIAHGGEALQCEIGIAVHAVFGQRVMAEQPRPDRSLVVGAVAPHRVATVVAVVGRIVRTERAQPEAGQQRATNRVDDACCRGAFDQGQIPTVACFSKATVALGVDLDRLLGALQKFVDRHLAPVWGTPARLVRASGFVRRAWAMVFLDDADVKDALAYHDLTPDGFPLAKIFVRTTLRNGDKVSVSAAHELAEMLVDPAINLASTGPRNMLYAYETADPVESEEFPVDGVPMTDFVYPSYFEAFRKPGSTKFDHLGRLRRPFQILPGGYQIVYRNGRWTQIYGSKAKARRLAAEDRRGHRSTYRGHPPVRRSAARWGKVLATFATHPAAPLER